MQDHAQGVTGRTEVRVNVDELKTFTSESKERHAVLLPLRMKERHAVLLPLRMKERHAVLLPLSMKELHAGVWRTVTSGSWSHPVTII